MRSGLPAILPCVTVALAALCQLSGCLPPPKLAPEPPPLPPPPPKSVASSPATKPTASATPASTPAPAVKPRKPKLAANMQLLESANGYTLFVPKGWSYVTISRDYFDTEAMNFALMKEYRVLPQMRAGRIMDSQNPSIDRSMNAILSDMQEDTDFAPIAKADFMGSIAGKKITYSHAESKGDATKGCLYVYVHGKYVYCVDCHVDADRFDEWVATFDTIGRSLYPVAGS